MTVGELVGRIIVYGGLAVAGYYLYQAVYVEPVTRTSVDRNSDPSVETGEDNAPNLDDCQRYVNADAVQDCIRARTEQ